MIARLVLKNNYWGYLFSLVRVQPDESFHSVMGVAVENDGTISLYYKESLVKLTNDSNLEKLLIHEGLHLLNQHLPRLLRIVGDEVNNHVIQQKVRLFNIAADMAVNSQVGFNTVYIDDKEYPLITPALYNFPNKQATEWYYLQLLKQPKADKKNTSGQNGSDKLEQSKKNTEKSHSRWRTSGVSDYRALSRKAEQFTRRIVGESKRSFSKERGKLPSYITELISDLLEPPKLPYYELIKKLVVGSRFTKFKVSPTRINRKRTYAIALADQKDIVPILPFPGKTRDFTFNIVVLLDTSGSMSKDEIKEGLSSVRDIIQHDRYCSTTVLEVDTEIEKEYVVKKIDDIQFNIKGRGGTTLGPGLFRAKELECDVCLAFTDGYVENINAYPKEKLPKRVIWVVSKQGIVDNINRTGFVVQL